MNKTDLIREISARSGYTQKDIKVVMSTLEEIIKDTLTNDREEKIALGTLGKFQVKHVPAKSGTSRLSGEEKEWKTDPVDKIVFKGSKTAAVLA